MIKTGATKKEFRDVVRTLMTTPIEPAKNPKDFLEHFGKETISTFEYIKSIQKMLWEHLGNDSSIKQAEIHIAELLDSAHRITQPQKNYTALVSKATPVDLLPNAFMDLYSRTMQSAMTAVEKLDYKQQIHCDLQDMCVKEKDIAFEEIKQNTLTGIRHINSTAVKLFEEYEAFRASQPQNQNLSPRLS